jgi:signal transduction histidine kinase
VIRVPTAGVVTALHPTPVVATEGDRHRGHVRGRRDLRRLGRALGVVALWLVALWLLAIPVAIAADLWAGAGVLLVLGAGAAGLAMLVRRLRVHIDAARAVERMARCMGMSPNPARLRAALAAALGDPTVEILVRAGGDWRDDAGQLVRRPAPGSGRGAYEIRAHGTLLAAVVHDERLRPRRELLEACLALSAVVLDNRRLAMEAASSLEEVRRSRVRIAAGAARERHRIARDLHDGAQQRLVALRIKLALAAELVEHDPNRGAAMVRDLGDMTEEALDELRSLANGVYPSLLADRGLREALRAAARCSPVAVELRADDLPRYSTDVESAVYFCVLEALQNVAKHATGARVAVVQLAHTRADLRFSITDDGGGMPGGGAPAGSGIANMRDRLATLSGDLAVASTPGGGIRVSGRVPAGERVAT